MTPGDLIFWFMFTNVKIDLILPKLNTHVKFQGYVGKAVSCMALTVNF